MPNQSDCVDAVKSSMIAAQRLLYKSIFRETNHEKTRTHRHHIHACPFRLQHHFRRRQRCERSRQRRKQCRSGCERQNVRHSAVRKNKTAQVYRLGGFALHCIAWLRHDYFQAALLSTPKAACVAKRSCEAKTGFRHFRLPSTPASIHSAAATPCGCAVRQVA